MFRPTYNITLDLVIVAIYITLLCSLQQGCEGLLMVTMIRLVAYNHYIISCYDDLFNIHQACAGKHHPLL